MAKKHFKFQHPWYVNLVGTQQQQQQYHLDPAFDEVGGDIIVRQVGVPSAPLPLLIVVPAEAHLVNWLHKKFTNMRKRKDILLFTAAG